VDVKLSAGGSHGRGAEAHHQREQTAEVTVFTLRHGVIRVEDTEGDLYAAIDLVTDKLKRKMGKIKEKAVQRNLWPGRGGTKGGDNITDHLASSDEEELPINGVAAPPAPEIVREKVLLLDGAMEAEEAVDRLEAVGHDFFVFKDKKDGALKVVYRRRANGYGLLIPQVE
jgi:ribosome-associated translation inhibitor RaiA